MTINALHRQLGRLIQDGHGRKLVCVNKQKCTHVLEDDGVCIIPATGAEIQTHEMMDDDGGFKELANGTVAQRTALVIVAEC